MNTATMTAPAPVDSGGGRGASIVSGLLPVASYARRSKRKGGDGKGATINIADQHAQNRAYAAHAFPGAPVVEYDDNMSAWNPDVSREGWESLLDDVRAGQYRAVVGRYADRLTRQPEQGEKLLAACREGKAELHTTSAGHHTSPLMFRIELALAAEESDQKSRRLMDKHRTIATAGGFHGGRRRFGYAPGMRAVVPEERDAIRSAARRILAGESLASICREWNGKGMPTAEGKEWRSTNLGKMMRGPHLAGIRVHNGAATVAAWPAILDRDTHDALVRYLSDPERRTRPEKQAGRVYALSGLVRCGVCGDPCYGKPTKLKAGPAYTCRTNKHVHAPVRDVDGTVRELVVERLTRVDAAGLFVSPANAAEAEARRTERDALEGRRAELGAAIAAGQLSPALAGQAEAAIADRLAELDADDARADDALARPARVLDGLTGHPYDATAARFDALPADRQRAVVALLGTPTLHKAPRKGVGLTWSPDRITFDWATPGA
jgi:site-specific DNA recombinase